MMTMTAKCFESLHPERTMPYLQFLPADYAPRKTYPLVIFLCGIGECGEAIEPFAPRLRDIPIWAFHGDADGVVLCDGSRRMVERVNAYGGQAKLTIYEGVGHDSWEPAYREPELIPWMLAKSKAK